LWFDLLFNGLSSDGADCLEDRVDIVITSNERIIFVFRDSKN